MKSYKQMFESFIRNKLISLNQSGFKPDHSCTNQLLATTYEIYKSFAVCFNIRAVFLDILKDLKASQSLAPRSHL